MARIAAARNVLSDRDRQSSAHSPRSSKPRSRWNLACGDSADSASGRGLVRARRSNCRRWSLIVVPSISPPQRTALCSGIVRARCASNAFGS